MIKAIVTKTGNSYALRVPKRYIDDNHLKLGDTVEIEEPISEQQRTLHALVQLGKDKGAIKGIANPVQWQRHQRMSADPWDEVNRDSSRQ